MSTLQKLLIAMQCCTALTLYPLVGFAQSAGTMNLTGPSTTPGSAAITAPALNAAVNAQLANKVDVAGGNASAALVTATGAAQPRTAAAMAADVFNVQNFIEPSDADSTAGVGRAVAALEASANGGTLFFPSTTDYTLSSNIAVTIGANQKFNILGFGEHGARLHWTNAASAGFTVTMAPVLVATWISNGPSVSAEGITCVSDWNTTTSQSCLTVISAIGVAGPPQTYTRPLPPSVTTDNVATISKTNSGGFLNVLNLQGIATSKFSNTSMWASTGDTTANAVAVSSPSGNIRTGLRFDGLRQQSGGTALAITDYIQGVYVTDMQTVGSQHSISWTNPLGYTGADNLIVDHSQLNSALSEIDTSGVSDVQIIGNYLLAGGVGWHGIGITGGIDQTIASNSLKFGSGDATGYGIKLTNASYSTVANNSLYGLLGATASTAPIILAGTTGSTTVTGNASEGSYVAWDASATPVSNIIQANIGLVGGASDVITNLFPGAPASNLSYLSASGPDAAIQWVLQAKGLPNVDFNFQDGTGKTIFQVNDSQNAGSDGGATLVARPNGVSPYFEAKSLASNLMLGAPGALAASSTGGMIQIPYMASAPTGTPATTGGATEVYNTSTHSLNIYDPTAAGWYHVTLTAGAD